MKRHPNRKKIKMKTHNLILTCGVAAFAAITLNATASDALLSPRAAGNRIQHVSGTASDVNLGTASTATVSPRAAGNKVTTVTGMFERRESSLHLRQKHDRQQPEGDSSLRRESLCGNEDDANDLAQETFVRVFKSRDSFRMSEKFSTWLFTIAANLARNHFRWRSRHPNISLETENAEMEQTLGSTLPAVGPAPNEQALAAERAAAVRAAVGNCRRTCARRLCFANGRN